MDEMESGSFLNMALKILIFDNASKGVIFYCPECGLQEKLITFPQ